MKETAPTNTKHHHRHALLLLAVVGIFFLLLSTSITSSGDLINEINNFGHIVLFGVFAIGLLFWIRSTQQEHIQSTNMQYLLTFLTAIGIATFAEFLQVFGSRSADLVDALRNAVGVTTFLGCYALFDVRLERLNRLRRGTKAACLVLLLIIPTFAFQPVAKAAHFEYLKYKQLPVLMDFDDDWEYSLALRSGANIYPLEGGSHNRRARAQFQPNTFASLLFKHFWHNWKSFSKLHIELESEAQQEETLSLLVYDQNYQYEWDDGYRLDAVLQPGINVITIDLRDVEQGPQTRKLELCCIKAIELFRAREPRQLSIRIKRVVFE